ncbi:MULTISPECIES: DUF5131 family protein [unclassified Arthrobacter]|uniref:DUF5131 family protein n=1 Tax=unclassified Arthrobacter TaxID=235627 RepID=UPI0027D8161A|nr:MULTISPECIES: DUF5131 family protein [unclassified Arthrobacter]
MTSGPGFGVSIHPLALESAKALEKPRLVFVNSMSDIFHAKGPFTFARDIFDVIKETPQTHLSGLGQAIPPDGQDRRSVVVAVKPMDGRAS